MGVLRVRQGVRALDLDGAWPQIRDDSGEPLTDRLLRPKIRAWRPSARGPDLIDLELDAPVPGHARPLWDRRLAGPPQRPGVWAGLGARQREAWLELVRDRSGREGRHRVNALIKKLS